MSVATKTNNYGLPIFAGTDHGNWFDFNSGFQAIDTAIKASAQAAESAQTAAAAATQLANSASSLSDSVNTNLAKLSNDISTWTYAEPTNANASIFQAPANSAIYQNAKLNLLNIRMNVNGVTGQTFNNDTKIINMGLDLGLSAERVLNSLLFTTYYDTSNVRHTQILSATINTDNTISVRNAAPSDMDSSKPWTLSINTVLCTYGWFD